MKHQLANTSFTWTASKLMKNTRIQEHRRRDWGGGGEVWEWGSGGAWRDGIQGIFFFFGKM